MAKTVLASAVLLLVAGTVKGVAMFDYLDQGQKKSLAPGARIVIGYLQSCQREVITGGQITVGVEQSQVTDGKVARERMECDGGALKLTKEQAGKSAVTMFRAPARSASGKGRVPKPQLTIYGASPVINLTKAAAIKIPVREAFEDFAKSNQALAPGGVYRLSAGGRSIIVKVDPFVEQGAAPPSCGSSGSKNAPQRRDHSRRRCCNGGGDFHGSGPRQAGRIISR